jgi:hypothetical protein
MQSLSPPSRSGAYSSLRRQCLSGTLHLLQYFHSLTRRFDGIRDRLNRQSGRMASADLPACHGRRTYRNRDPFAGSYDHTFKSKFCLRIR